MSSFTSRIKSKYLQNYNYLSSSNKHFIEENMWPKSIALWMAAFYVTLFIIRPWEQLIPWLAEIHFERLYAISMIIVTFLSPKKSFKMNFQSIAVLFFLGSIGISALFAINSSLAWEQVYTYLTVTIFYFILLFVINTPYELIFMTICYIASITIYLAKAQWEFFIHGQHRYDMGVVRLIGIESTFGGPNNLAMSIVVSLPMGLFLWSNRKLITSQWSSTWQKYFSYSLLVYFYLAVSSIILTNSRSGFLGATLFIVITFFRKKGLGQKISYIFLSILVCIIIWHIIPEQNKNRFRTIWNPEAGPASAHASAQGRIEGFKAGLKMFEKFPLTGVGVGNFIPYRVNYVDGVALNAHNLIGQVLGETGIIGALGFFLMVVTIFVNCHKVKSISKTHPIPLLTTLADLATACRNSIILLFFEGLFGHNLLRFNWLWIAAFAVLNKEFSEEIINTQKSKSRKF